MIRSLPTLALACFATLGSQCLAIEPPSTDDIAGWVQQLNHDEFTVRQSAQEKLEAVGAPAVEALGKAALSEEQETAVRAINILKKHARGDDGDAKQASKKTLKKLAEGDDKAVADRAASALKPAVSQDMPSPPQSPPFPFDEIRSTHFEFSEAIINGDSVSRITVKKKEGNKETSVEENGRSVKIRELATGEIKVTIINKEGDMHTTKEVEADSAEGLSEKDPETYKIYEQYSKASAAEERSEIRVLQVGPLEGAEDRMKRFERRLKKIMERARMSKDLGDPSESAEEDEKHDEIRKQTEEQRKQMEKMMEKLRELNKAIEGPSE